MSVLWNGAAMRSRNEWYNSNSTDKVNKLINDNYLKKAKESQAALYNRTLNDLKKLHDSVLNDKEIKELNKKLNEHFNKVFSDLLLQIKSNRDDEIKIEDIIDERGEMI